MLWVSFIHFWFVLRWENQCQAFLSQPARLCFEKHFFLVYNVITKMTYFKVCNIIQVTNTLVLVCPYICVHAVQWGLLVLQMARSYGGLYEGGRQRPKVGTNYYSFAQLPTRIPGQKRLIGEMASWEYICSNYEYICSNYEYNCSNYEYVIFVKTKNICATLESFHQRSEAADWII